jgi:vancomycin resistance protein YoaR
MAPGRAMGQLKALGGVVRSRLVQSSFIMRAGVAAGLTLLVMLGAVLLWLLPLALPVGAAAQGLTIAGGATPGVGAPWRATIERLRGGSESALALETLVRGLGQRLEASVVSLSLAEALPGVELGATLGELGVHVDVDETLRRARAVGRRGSPITRHAELSRARAGKIDVPLALTFDRRAFFERHAALKAELDRREQPARYPFGSAALVPDVPGRALDLEGAANVLWSRAVERAALVGAAGAEVVTLELGFVPLVARVNAVSFADFEPRVELARYATRFRVHGDQATRARNIAVAASRIDGQIVLPGERISFNQLVGERSVENGFFDSWELLDGAFVRGVGGGTCQVSSTLNAAALRAGLGIIESFTHSRPLAYIEKGLDATVAWPFVDLKLENAWRVPVVLQAAVRGNTLTVRVLAESMPGRVSLRTEVEETYPFPRVVEVARVARGSFKLKQPGIPGYRIQRTRTLTEPGKSPRREVVFKRYRPTPELFLVAPDFDVRELPPLSEGAEGYAPPPEAAPEDESEQGPDARVRGFLG